MRDLPPPADPWLGLVRRAGYTPAGLRREMGLTPEQFEYFQRAPAPWPLEAWLRLVRAWDAATLVWRGRGRAEIEPLLGLPNPGAFWRWNDGVVEIALGDPGPGMRIRGPSPRLGQPELEPARALGCPAARGPGDWRRLGPLCHGRNRAQDGHGPTACTDGCPFVAFCLFERMCHGAELAREAIATLVLNDHGLRGRLLAKWPAADEHLITEAIERAVQHYYDDPCRFNPGKAASLLGFLHMLAVRRLGNLERAEFRRQTRVAEGSLDEDPPGSTLPSLASEPSPAELVLASEAEFDREQLVEQRKALLREFIRRQPPADQQVFQLILSGKRCRLPYAEILCVTDKPDAEQAKIVNKRKDLLEKRLRLWLLTGGRKGQTENQEQGERRAPPSEAKR